MDAVEAGKIINACPEGWRVLAVAVPTRALRIIVNDLNLLFRVEQLVPQPGRTYAWRVVSTHAGDASFESYPPAIKDMLTKQARLKEKIKLAQHEARMAQIKAENPIATS
jgi:hypothetical protein